MAFLPLLPWAAAAKTRGDPVGNACVGEWLLGGRGWEEGKKQLHLTNFSEKAMATHSSTLAWKIPWTEEPGSLQSMGLRKVGHD